MTIPQASEVTAALSTDALKPGRNRSIIEWIASGSTRGDGHKGETSKEAANAAELARPFAHPYFWAGFAHTGL